MAGWNLKEGICANQDPSDQGFWDALIHLYSSTHKTTTYKFCFLKCILDLSADVTKLEITFDDLFRRFAEIYWDLIVKYGLSQVYANSKFQRSNVEVILEEVVSRQHSGKSCEINDLPRQTSDNMLDAVTKFCSQNVIGAFFESTYGLFYSFSKKEKTLTLTPSSKSFLQRYARSVEEINYFNWAKMIEKINGNYTPSSLITKMSKLGRSPQATYALPKHDALDMDKRFNLEDILPWS